MSLPTDPARVRAPDEQTAARECSDQSEHSWIMQFRTAGSRPPLFCACALGGNVFDYRDLADLLHEDQPVYAFGVPPSNRGRHFQTVEEIAAAYVLMVRRLQASGPYYLCGHSFGGLVVYEMAMLLEQQGEVASLVALFDTEHPAYSQTLPPKHQAQFYATYLVDRISKYARNLSSGRIDRIAADVIRFCRSRIKGASFRAAHAVLGGLNREIPALVNSPELMLSAAWRAYKPREYRGRVVLFVAADRTAEYQAERTLGWKTCATGALEVQTVPGDHRTMLQPPLVSVLAKRLTLYLTFDHAPNGEGRS